jgi:hypothetical protein
MLAGSGTLQNEPFGVSAIVIEPLPVKSTVKFPKKWLPECTGGRPPNVTRVQREHSLATPLQITDFKI